MTSADTTDAGTPPATPQQVLADLGDRRIAERLGRLAGESDPHALAAAQRLVRSLREGSVCLDLAELGETGATWRAVLADSPLVVPARAGERRPLVLRGDLLYLDRYHRQERVIADAVDAAAHRDPPRIDADAARAAAARLFPGDGARRQRLAALVAASRWFTILAGGPGTGKTTAVARLLALLAAQPTPPRVALAAPTGKAKARLQQATAQALAGLDPADADRVGAPEAVTLHRLLGARRGSSQFRYGADNRLPHDLVVVDEASMVSLTLMAQLMSALREDTRLVLVGDPDQLTSVEAGAVLGDLVARPAAPDAPVPPLLADLAADDLDALDEDERDAALRRGVVRLHDVHRFVPAIGELAEAVRRGDPDRVLGLLRAGGSSVEFLDVEPGPRAALDPLRADIATSGASLAAAAAAGDAEAALAALDSHRLLCAHREGPAGVTTWNARSERWIAEQVPGYAAGGPWYLGRPVMITANDYSTGLFNGDCGVVLSTPGGARAAFARDGATTIVAPYRLGDVQTVHALTVHRSQGSQYDAVSVLVPGGDSRPLSRELLYTAITRARRRVRVVGTVDAVAAAVGTPVQRASGLRIRD